MLPTNDHIAVFRVMAILQKVPAPKLELNANSLPPISAAINTALRLAIRVGGMTASTMKPNS
jgi:hypothetical protein